MTEPKAQPTIKMLTRPHGRDSGDPATSTKDVCVTRVIRSTGAAKRRLRSNKNAPTRERTEAVPKSTAVRRDPMEMTERSGIKATT